MEDSALQIYGCDDGAYAWVLGQAEVLEEPLRWSCPQGCIVWARMPGPLLELINITPRKVAPEGSLLKRMEAACLEMKEESREKARLKGEKRKRGSV